MKYGFFVIAILCVIQGGVAQNSTVHGLIFGDYYWAARHHNASIKDKNGFWIRRVFLTADRFLTSKWDVRIRLEMNSSGNFSSSEKLSPYLKDAFLRYNGEKIELLMGISPTPCWYQVFKLWGYRHVERTPALLQKMYGSRDLGIAIKGGILQNNMLKYHLMFGNGSGLGSETDKGKQINAAITLPAQNILLQVSGYYESLAHEHHRSLVQLLLGYRKNTHRAGLLYARHQNKTTTGKHNLGVLSLFASRRIDQSVSAFARWDHTFNKNPRAGQITYWDISAQAKTNILIGGIDIELEKEIHLLPNIKAVIYKSEQENQTAPDLFINLTLYAKF